MDKIYTDAEIRAKADRALIFSWLYTGISISLFVYAGYSFFNDAVVTGFSSMAIGFLLFIPQSIYKRNIRTNQVHKGLRQLLKK